MSRLEWGEGETWMMRMKGQIHNELVVTEIINQESNDKRWTKNEDKRQEKDEDRGNINSDKEELIRPYIVEAPRESPKKKNEQ